MKFTQVESSNIAEIAFDEEKEALFVKFKNDTVYEYSEVPYYVFEEMLSADSVGSYFHKNVRSSYEFSKL